MTLRSSFKEASFLAKSTVILVAVFLVSCGLCGYEIIHGSATNSFLDNALGVAILIGMITSTVGLALIVISGIVNHFRRSMSDKDPSQ